MIFCLMNYALCLAEGGLLRVRAQSFKKIIQLSTCLMTGLKLDEDTSL
jgi:hypothetical protein